MTETAVRRGPISAAEQGAVAALLDLEDPPGSTLPELWHWTQLLDAPAQTSKISAAQTSECTQFFSNLQTQK